MLARLRCRLTYANVMATVAVFVALGGTSYAALTITGRNVKNASLTGADIKDGSVGSRDLAKGLLKSTPGPQGPAGPAGPAGASGATGPKGADGSDATAKPADVTGYDTAITTNQNVVGAVANGGWDDIATLTLPAGTYFVSAETQFYPAANTVNAQCVLRDASQTDVSPWFRWDTLSQRQQLVIMDTVTLPAATTITWKCSVVRTGDAARVGTYEHRTLRAVKLTSLNP